MLEASRVISMLVVLVWGHGVDAVASRKKHVKGQNPINVRRFGFKELSVTRFKMPEMSGF